ALLLVYFYLMNTINTSTSVSSFMLRMGYLFYILPPLLLLPQSTLPTISDTCAQSMVAHILDIA
ncbi:hypothetical protein HETIRDRAFT_306991, partial [Heterobasidion irregulare TC 32-1]